ncbi:ABC transporter permease [Aquibaculum arenosum]|uniref:Iron ABC transporter permease n=1 Tax=Aquibaculum arenosum TaxID=3032591 RepID=A0ABT5YHJ2_9PROT|nr:iron ABC transporter permease [Fodinicurvata sp. CAU 1616]MDF2094408.1 iron ABC transporter permease [Fodinicurvata sp. CAU 1616]
MSQLTDTLGIDATPPRPAAIRRSRRLGLLTLLALLVALLLSIPVLTIAWNVVQPSSDVMAHLASTVLPRYLVNTLILVAVVGSGVMLIGVGTAWLVTMYSFPGRCILQWALILPLAVPAYVMAYAYTDFLQFSGPVQSGLRDLFGWQTPRDYWFPNIRSVEGAGIMLMLVLYPYVYLLSRAAFLQQSVCALEVSRTLGCNGWSTFLRVGVPLARPAIVAGTVLALMETLADYGTVQYFGVQTFTTGIYRAWFSLYDHTTAAQLSAMLLGIVLLFLLLERWNRGAQRYHHTSVRYRHLPQPRLGGTARWLSTLICALPVVLGFLLPAAVLVSMGLDNGIDVGRFLPQAFNTFILGAVTAVLAVGFAILVAYGARLQPGPLTTFASRVASLGYAVPGSVIGVGILIPFAWFDNSLDAWLRDSLGISSGLLLTGGIAALVFAYLVRFLAVSLQAVEAGLAKVRGSMDDAARTLGRGPSGTLVAVHAPLLWSSLLTAGLLVFVDVMKELPATLIMRPFDFDTLAVQAHNYAADERLGAAATPALMIVAVGLIPVLLLSRAIAQARPGGGEGPD